MTTIGRSELDKLINDALNNNFRDKMSEMTKNIAEETGKVFAELSKLQPNKLASTWKGPDDSEPKFKTGYNKKAKELFGDSGETKGFNSFGEVLQAVRHNDYNKLQHLEKDMDTLTGESGGFLVPQKYSNAILDLMIEQEICRPRCRVFTIKGEGNSMIIPAVDDFAHNTDIAGIKTYWTGEGQSYTESQAKIRQISLKVNKLTALVDCSEELISDSSENTEQFLGNLFSKSLAFEIDNRVLTTNGTGSANPLGIPNSPALIEIAGEAGQTTDTIQYENVCNMVMRMTPASFNNSIWLSSLSNLKQLLLLNMKIGTAGSHIQVFTESNNTYKILGRPLIWTEHCNVLGDAGNLKLFDLSQYAMLLKGGILIRSDSSLGFKSDVVSFKASIRLDGEPIPNKVLTLKDSVTQCSPFIQLGSI
jgi:HK97 family phage major capsid protein